MLIYAFSPRPQTAQAGTATAVAASFTLNSLPGASRATTESVRIVNLSATETLYFTWSIGTVAMAALAEGTPILPGSERMFAAPQGGVNTINTMATGSCAFHLQFGNGV